jgi:Flp pilus assembly protein TadD
MSTDRSLSLARKAAKANDWLTAHHHCQTVLEKFPKNKKAAQILLAMKPQAVPALLKEAQAAQQRQDWTAAESHLEAAAGIAPEVPEIRLALAACLLEVGKFPSALRNATKVLKQQPTHPGALNTKGRALREMGRGAEAEQAFSAALGHGKADAQTWSNLGVLARAQGDRALAKDCFERALRLDPGSATLHHSLAQTLEDGATQDHVRDMQAVLATKNPDDPATAPLHFGLFKLLDTLNDRERAFSHLDRGNTLARRAHGTDFNQFALPFALTKALFAEQVVPAPYDGPLRPIFIIGLPRTGTSLVERILSRADGTQPCGELTVVQNAISKLLKTVTARPEKALRQDDISWLQSALTNGYADYSDGSPVLIDKNPLNFRWAGFLARAFPQAKFVHVSRDPMAVAWSIYSRLFAGAGNGFAYDVEDIARFMVLHRDLMAHWHSVCPDRVFELPYSELVSDTATTTKALASAVDLDWSEDWLSPEKSRSQVLTASSNQVTKPIYSGSDSAWKRYETQLAPMRVALQSAGLI